MTGHCAGACKRKRTVAFGDLLLLLLYLVKTLTKQGINLVSTYAWSTATLSGRCNEKPRQELRLN